MYGDSPQPAILKASQIREFDVIVNLSFYDKDLSGVFDLNNPEATYMGFWLKRTVPDVGGIDGGRMFDRFLLP